MGNVPLLPDDAAAEAILRDAEAAESAAYELLKSAYAQHKADTEAVKQALTLPASAQGF